MDSARKPTRPPYAPVKGVREFFDLVTSKAPPPRVNKGYLAELGVAANNEQHLVATIRFLQLIDETGRPTRRFDLLYLKGPERTRGLQNLLRLAYPSLFTGELDLRTASRAEIHDHFVRRYELHGQMARKATSLFAYLCALAGIAISPELAQDGRSGVAVRSGRGSRSAVPRGAPLRPEPGSEEVAKPNGRRGIAPSGIQTAAGWPIMVMLTPDMTEDDMVVLLCRIKRAVERADAEG